MSAEVCDVCLLPSRNIACGMCAYCRSQMRYPDDGQLRTPGPARFDTCEICGAEIDGPGYCPRCTRELDEDFEELRLRGMA